MNELGTSYKGNIVSFQLPFMNPFAWNESGLLNIPTIYFFILACNEWAQTFRDKFKPTLKGAGFIKF